MGRVVDYERRDVWGPPSKIGRRLIVATSIIVALALLARSGFFSGERFCCTEDDLDYDSGRIRHTKYLFYCKISDNIEESSLTKALGEKALQGQTPDWHAQCLTALWGDANCRRGLAIQEIDSIERIWDRQPFTDGAKRQIAKNILYIWRRDGEFFTSREYISELCQLIPQGVSANVKSLDITDLPPVPTRPSRPILIGTWELMDDE
jgi:hypothetical protein